MTTADVRRRTLEEVRTLYKKPLLDLAYQAAGVHRAHHDAREVQTCTLLSVKTGGCPEDCAYCPQSARYTTGVAAEKMLPVSEVLDAAKRAKENGSTRFCMGAAWREAKDGNDFDNVIEMVRGVKALGLEACTTLGMVSAEQAERLKEAGLTAYNHNLDSSGEFYDEVISTRTYEDRLKTIRNVSQAGISVCCGGILGMGESAEDRITLLHKLQALDPQPESVPINALVPMEGTPLAERPPLDVFDFVRSIAVARILLPKAKVRLSAGRLALSREAQALAFLAGANSIFTGDKLLTTPNPEADADASLFSELDLRAKRPDVPAEHTEPAPR
jgi:biotin synthase